MTTTEKLLCRIEKGGTLDELATEFSMRKSVLMARIEFMARAGYLCEIRSGNGCERVGHVSRVLMKTELKRN